MVIQNHFIRRLFGLVVNVGIPDYPQPICKSSPYVTRYGEKSFAFLIGGGSYAKLMHHMERKRPTHVRSPSRCKKKAAKSDPGSVPATLLGLPRLQYPRIDQRAMRATVSKNISRCAGLRHYGGGRRLAWTFFSCKTNVPSMGSRMKKRDATRTRKFRIVGFQVWSLGEVRTAQNRYPAGRKHSRAKESARRERGAAACKGATPRLMDYSIRESISLP